MVGWALALARDKADIEGGRFGQLKLLKPWLFDHDWSRFFEAVRLFKTACVDCGIEIILAIDRHKLSCAGFSRYCDVCSCRTLVLFRAEASLWA